MSARTILNPPLINELNGLFDGSTSIDVSSIDATSLTLGIAPATVVLTGESNTLSVGGGNSIVECGNIVSNGSITLGATGNTVQLSGTSNTLSLGGGFSLLNCGNINSNGTCNADAFGITNGANAISLQCLSPAVLTVGGSCIASSFSAPYYGGGLYAGLYSTPVSVPANSAYPITIGSIPYNPISGWVPSSIFPQFTLTSSLGGIAIQDIELTKNGDNTLTIGLTVYNSNPSNAQTLTSFYWLLFYQ